MAQSSWAARRGGVRGAHAVIVGAGINQSACNGSVWPHGKSAEVRVTFDVPPHASPPAPSLLRELAPGPASEPTVAESRQAGWCLVAGVRLVYGFGSN